MYVALASLIWSAVGSAGKAGSSGAVWPVDGVVSTGGDGDVDAAAGAG